jgi:hypothetical protein
MTKVFEKYAHIRALYPEDIERIEAEEGQVKQLLELKDYASNPVTKRVLEMCRTDVIACRRKLATDRVLMDNLEAQRELWAIIDARMWFIGLVARDFDGEIQMIENGLDIELQR